MPAYDFVCNSCRNEFEIRGTVEEYQKGLIKACPFCGSKNFEQKLNPLQVVRSRRSGSGGSSCCGPNSGSGCCG